MSTPEHPRTNGRVWIAAGAIIAGVTIILAALKDHVLRDWLAIPETRIFDLALQYQFYHSLGLMICGLVSQVTSSRMTNLIGLLFLFGIVGFCGGLYLRIALPTVQIAWIIPVGAISWVVGWFLLALVVISARSCRNAS